MTNETVTDFISEMSGGMQSGISPLLLQKNQYAVGINCSIRGGYIHTKPPYKKHTFIWPDPLLQAVVESGNFQGGGYYRPDYGMESLLAQISGHLIKFTETGTAWTVTDVSIPGDLNSAAQSQVWMWQSEKWMIIQDGSGVLPIFFDGVKSRRSYGKSVILGSVISVSNAGPNDTGAKISATLSAPYTGKYNIPVLFNGEYYQVTPPSYFVIAIGSANALVGTTIPTGSQLISDPSFAGYLISNATPTLDGAGCKVTIQSLPPDQFDSIPGTQIALGGYVWDMTSIGVNPVTFVQTSVLSLSVNPFGGTFPTFSTGTLLSKSGVISPSLIRGITSDPFVVPSLDQVVNIPLTNAFNGSPGDHFQIGEASFIVTANPPQPTPPISSTVALINLSDTAAITGLPQDIMSIPELPAGRMGAYGTGRNWMSLTDGISYVAGDIVGGAAGTAAENYRDAVLKMTENTFLAGGGAFRLPGTGDYITAMTFPATMDTSLGQGPLQIFTAFTAFSNNSPVDRTTWATVKNPIQTESLVGYGALGQNSTIPVNSDTFFRSNAGIGSLILARRDFVNNSWGNKTVSNEMQRILNRDNKVLLSFGSADDFDNRFFETCNPNSTGLGTMHAGLVSLNMDLMSSLRGDSPPSWEGAWTGLNVLRIIGGRVNGTVRSFVFTGNLTTNKLELWELLPENTTSYLDNDTTPIVMAFETGALFNRDVAPITKLKKLIAAKLFLSKIKGNVNVKVYYKPDFYPCWTLWRSLDFCSDVSGTNHPGYKIPAQLGGVPIAGCESSNNRPLSFGYFYQFRFVITGSCQFEGFVPVAMISPTTDSVTGCDTESCTVTDCDTPDDFDVYSLQGFST